MSVFAVTGASGQIAGKLIPLLSRQEECEKIIGIDIKPPQEKFEKFEFLKKDVRSPELKEVFQANKVQVIFHLAFVLNPIHNKELMFEINLKGTENVLKCAREAEAEQVIVTSSGTAYGAHPDNPVPLKEEHPLRAEPEFDYAYHKREMDLLCQEFAQNHPELKITIFRPCIVVGKRFENYIARVLLHPFNFFIAGADPYLQFIAEEDVARGLMLSALKRKEGIFNLAGEGWLKLSEIWEIKKRLITLNFPEWFIYPAVRLGWRIHFPIAEFPAGAIDYFRYPWVVDISKAEKELGFVPEYSSRKVWEDYIRWREENPLGFWQTRRKKRIEKRTYQQAKGNFSS